MREGLTVIIVLLIIGIVLDGIRRVRAARRERIHMSSSLPEDDFDDDSSRSEFPSGGARIAAYRHPEDAVNLHENLKTSLAASKKTAAVAKRSEPAASSIMDEMDDHIDPVIGSFDNIDDEGDLVIEAPVRAQSKSEPKSQPKAQFKTQTAPTNHSQARVKVEPTPAQLEPEEVIVINVMAHPGEMFQGTQLLDVLTQQNMRFGAMEIFHRHKNENGTGEILFSLANIVKPGTYDLTTMDEFETPGISIFMTLPINGDSVAAFGLMARTAKAISEALGGELKDEQRSVMTQQTFEHCRQRVIEFERKRRLSR